MVDPLVGLVDGAEAVVVAHDERVVFVFEADRGGAGFDEGFVAGLEDVGEGRRRRIPRGASGG